MILAEVGARAFVCRSMRNHFYLPELKVVSGPQRLFYNQTLDLRERQHRGPQMFACRCEYKACPASWDLGTHLEKNPVFIVHGYVG